MKLQYIFILLILFFVSCGNNEKTKVDQSNESKVSGKAIGYLKGRDYNITIWSSSAGPVYTIATKSGEVILDKKSIEYIKAENKDIYDILEEARANQSSGVIDASNREIWRNSNNKNELYLENSNEIINIHILEEKK